MYQSDTYGANTSPQSQRSRSVSVQQPAFYSWTPQPMPALYQLVPVDSSCVGYQPVYAQQQPQQHYQPPPPQAFYTIPAGMPMAPAMAPMAPMSPTNGGHFLAPMSPVRRHVSLGTISTPAANGGYYQHQPQPQPQSRPLQQSRQLPPQQQRQQFQENSPVPAPAFVHHMSTSPETARPFQISPIQSVPQQYQAAMLFATPPSEKRAKPDTAGCMAPAPATLPRAASRPSLRMMRPNRPRPLCLASSSFHRNGDENRAPSPLQVNQANPTGRPAAAPFLPPATPVGSDREYDAYGSSYSTSPMGSETYNKNGRKYVFGMVSETSEGTDFQSSRSKFVPRMLRMPKTPRTPKYMRGGHEAQKEAPMTTPSGHPLRRSHGKRHIGLQRFSEEHLMEGPTPLSDDDESDAAAAGVELSSSDEWYTTSDTNPVRSRHRHRVTQEGHTGAPGLPGVCNCGMQQCCRCGLFISRPETHMCMREVVVEH